MLQVFHLFEGTAKVKLGFGEHKKVPRCPFFVVLSVTDVRKRILSFLALGFMRNPGA
jgi:hypothetical protein